MKPSFPLFPLLLLAIGCANPADGVLAISFGLEPPPFSETRAFPPQADTAVPVAAWGVARGQCACDIETKGVRCTFENLPRPVSSQATLSYELDFLLWHEAIPARFDGRTIERDPGGHDPDLPPPEKAPPLPRAAMGMVIPDELGKAELVPPPSGIPLDRVAGGELHLVARDAVGGTRRWVVIDGRVGNLASGEPLDVPPPPPGHQH